MKLSPSVQKLLIGAVLFGSWSYLVYTGKVPATDFVENIKIGLGGLGLYHIVSPKAAIETSAPPVVPATVTTPAPTVITQHP